MIGQESLDSIHHAVDRIDLLIMLQTFCDDSVKTCVNYCSRTSGLAYKYVFLHCNSSLLYVFWQMPVNESRGRQPHLFYNRKPDISTVSLYFRGV